MVWNAFAIWYLALARMLLLLGSLGYPRFSQVSAVLDFLGVSRCFERCVGQSGTRFHAPELPHALATHFSAQHVRSLSGDLHGAARSVFSYAKSCALDTMSRASVDLYPPLLLWVGLGIPKPRAPKRKVYRPLWLVWGVQAATRDPDAAAQAAGGVEVDLGKPGFSFGFAVFGFAVFGFAECYHKCCRSLFERIGAVGTGEAQ